MRYLHKTGRTFRVERVPLCYMAEFAHCSTETRKIVKGEERIVHFLDEKGTVRQTDFRHPKAEACKQCSLNEIVRRIGNPDRVAGKKMASEQSARDFLIRHQVAPVPRADCLVLDSEANDAQANAQRIIRHFNLATPESLLSRSDLCHAAD